MNDAVITLNGLEKRFPGMDKPVPVDGASVLPDVPDGYRTEATSMLAMLVGAVVLSRAVDDETADDILAASRESISRSRHQHLATAIAK